MAKTKFRFSNFGFSHRPYRESEINLRWVLKTILTVVNWELKPSLFMPRPSVCRSDGVPLVGDLHNLALGGIKVHKPLGFQVLEGI